MDLTLTGLFTLATVAVTELAKRVKGKDYLGAGTIVFCAAVGAAAGDLHLAGLTVLTGLVAGLAAAGIHTVAQAASGK